MPELGPREHEIGKKIGEGVERFVYEIPDKDSDNVLAKDKAHFRETPEFKKGVFYMNKILSALFPEHIPKIHLAGASDEIGSVEVRQRIFNEEHVRNTELYDTADINSSELIDLDNKLVAFGKREGKEIERRLEEAGIHYIDTYNSLNFMKDDRNGNVYYVDTVPPWHAKKGGTNRLYFDENKLRQYAREHVDEPTQKRVDNYLTRLVALYDKDLANYHG